MTGRDKRATNKALYIGCEFGISGLSALLGSLRHLLKPFSCFPLEGRRSSVSVPNVACTKKDRS
jgi:hypothetical protein